ncbi:tetratricopeptide (TPR) repeat protein [Bradyrhizobium diazoefficiens]
MSGGDLAGAIADYDAAITLRQATRAALGEAWPIPWQHDLAAVLQNRGLAKWVSRDLTSAIADYDAAIALMLAIGTALAEAWPIPWQNDLAGFLNSRGLAKADSSDLAGAITDYDVAIGLMEGVRLRVGQVAWSSNPSWDNMLSTTRGNRAMALKRRE